VEFAIILALMIMMVAGLVEFGRVMWHYDALAKGTRDGARIVSITDFSSLGSAVSKAQTAVVAAATAARIAGLTASKVSVRCDDDMNDAADYACTDTRFTAASPPVRVIVGISGYSLTVGAILPMIRQDGSVWQAYSLALAPKTSMPYMK